MSRLFRILPILLVALALAVGVTSASGSFSYTNAANYSPNGSEWGASGNVGITQRAYLEADVAFCGGGGDYYNEFSPDSHVSAGRFYSTRHIEEVAIYLWSYTQGVGLVLEASRNIYLGCP